MSAPLTPRGARGGAFPVIGELRPWVLATIYPELDAGFDQFRTPTMGGLAKVIGARLDLLSLDAHRPGHGDCGRFLAECQNAYEEIRVLFIMNPQLDAMLKRRGFASFAAWQDGEPIDGLRWTLAAVSLLPGEET